MSEKKKSHLLKISLVFMNQLDIASCPRSYMFLENKLNMAWQKFSICCSLPNVMLIVCDGEERLCEVITIYLTENTYRPELIYLQSRDPAPLSSL